MGKRAEDRIGCLTATAVVLAVVIMLTTLSLAFPVEARAATLYIMSKLQSFSKAVNPPDVTATPSIRPPTAVPPTVVLLAFDIMSKPDCTCPEGIVEDCKYHIVEGDTISDIAFLCWESGKQEAYDQICEANEDTILGWRQLLSPSERAQYDLCDYIRPERYLYIPFIDELNR
jgi:hypothetical protein